MVSGISWALGHLLPCTSDACELHSESLLFLLKQGKAQADGRTQKGGRDRSGCQIMLCFQHGPVSQVSKTVIL